MNLHTWTHQCQVKPTPGLILNWVELDPGTEEPSSLSKLHCLCKCFVCWTRCSMFILRLWRGGKINFILNSFLLIWQLPPRPTSPQHRACSQHSGYLFCTHKAFYAYSPKNPNVLTAAQKLKTFPKYNARTWSSLVFQAHKPLRLI